MLTAINDKIYTVDEYILFDEASDIRHEFINGQLFDMSGTSDLHNEMCFNLTLLFKNLLSKNGYKIYMENVKVKIQNEDYYTYPDVFITKNEADKNSKYIKHFPELIIEVLSDSTRKYDTVDKFIQYQKIESLQYYILVEPEFTYVNCYTKEADGDWSSLVFNNLTDIVYLKNIDIELPIKNIYQP